MKTYFEINICNKGSVETIILKNKKEKNKWLVDYFMNGNGFNLIKIRYIDYRHQKTELGEKILPLKKYILNQFKNATKIFFALYGTRILIREKSF